VASATVSFYGEKMKVTKRARKLEKFLSEELGWETGVGRSICESNPKHVSYSGDPFCSKCGSKTRKENARQEVLQELEAALNFAVDRE
jgi:hypothetical protein